MKRKPVIVFLAFVLLIMNTVHVTASNQISVTIDGEPQYYSSEPVLVNGRIMVPLRDAFEMLGATVTWDSLTNKITIVSEGNEILLTIKQKIAFLNGMPISLIVAPKIFNNRAYVPLRFVAEAMNFEVTWYPSITTAEICTCKNNPSLSQEDALTYSIAGIQIGDPVTDVTTKLGFHQDRLPSQYPFDWFVYHQNYQNYLQIGMNQGEVVGFYSNNDQFKIGSITINSTKEDVQKAFGTPITSIIRGSRSYNYHSREDWDLYLLDGKYYTTFFYDIYDQRKVTAVHMVSKDYELSLQGYYGLGNETLRIAYEKQMYHLVNATRVKNQVPPLQWNELAARIAKAHSDDMARHDYFDHYNLQGKSPFDRLKEGGQNYRYAGENLAVGQFSAIFAHEGLMNSYGHRRNILNPQFRQIGIGVAFQENRPYFTQNYVTP
ncbi:stalk domain-containing protein [Anaerobacillus alkaliphilus]|uniref:stalk domain-containing protein n=1 Tax=Anaerobacillus alkaliphilus TaxID=1548597 RepID=UPI001375494C|nr:CAP-associated domain-containing protein [Anaerobacillus alkaliphilus]